MAYVTPRTWVAGAVLTAAQLNQDVRDNVAFLANPPACRIHKGTGTQSFGSGVPQTLTFENEVYDTNAMRNPANPDRITFAAAGLYVVTCQVILTAGADYNYVNISACKNAVLGSEMADGQVTDLDTSTAPIPSLAFTAKFAANDYITFYILQHNAAAAARLSLGLAERSPVATATWIGLG